MIRALAPAMVLSMALAACGSDKDDVEDTVASGASAVASGASAVASGASSVGAAAGGTTLKIGFMGDLTGENSGLVIPPRNATKLAIDNYNKTNPATKIEMVEYDSQADATKAVALAQQAIKTDKIVALVGPAFSGESAQVGPILEEAKVPSITMSATNAKLAANGWKYWHRMLAGDSVQGPGIGEYIAGPAAKKNVFVVDDKSEYGKPLADFVRKVLTDKGVKFESDSIDPAESDYSTAVNKAVAFKPDAIFFGGYYKDAGKLLKQLRDKGVKDATFFTGDGSLDKGLVEGAGAANAEKAVVGCPCLIGGADAPDPKVAKFAVDYKAAFNVDPAIYAAEGYDATTMFLEAIKAGNTTSETINTWLATADVPGVSKQMKFGPNGEVSATDTYIYQVKDGKIALLGNSKEAKIS